MLPPSLEEFKRMLAHLEREISSTSGSSTTICALCQPVQARLDEIIHARGDGFYGGTRDSTGNITIGSLSHALDHPECPLCGLLVRVFIRARKEDIFQKFNQAKDSPVSPGDIRGALATLVNEVSSKDNSTSDGDDVDDGSDESGSERNSWIESPTDDCFQVSIDAVPTTGAISVWLPLGQSDEVNDEESQLFLHPHDYTEAFGDPPKHVFLPHPENGKGRNLGLVKRCYEYCTANHAGCSQSESSAMPARLVDISGMRVIEVAQGLIFKYVALSYVWGTDPFITLTNATSDFLRSHGSLRHTTPQLPKTIQDAIEIAQLLGFQYIWIDSLCIKQDDRDDQKIELQRMHDIYANARLTLVAATGSNAQAPLLEIDPDLLSNEYHTIGDSRFCLDRPEFQPLVRFTTWFTRGWTLQELNCSLRLIYILPERTYYSCCTGSWNEDFPLDPSMPLEIYQQYFRDDDPKGVAFSGKESVSDCYIEIAEKLSLRQFTRDDDVLKALTGMYTMFVSNGLGPAAAGVPIAFLETGLMWQPVGRLRRRTAQSPDQPQPTWSWAGWAGPVTYPFSVGAGDIQPLSEWCLYLQTAEKVASGQYTHIDVTSALLKWTMKSGSSRWSNKRAPGRQGSVLNETSSILGSETEFLSPSTSVILESAILVCHACTYTVPIQTTPGPELPTRAGLRFYSILDSKEGSVIGELKVDTGTLDALKLDASSLNTAEVLPIARLDFSSPMATGLVWRNRGSRLGQFSKAFMEVVDQDSDMLIVLWLHRQNGVYCRVALGYVTGVGLSRCVGCDNSIILT